MIAYIVMQGYSYEGLSQDGGPHQVYFDEITANKFALTLRGSREYGEVVEIEIDPQEYAEALKVADR